MIIRDWLNWSANPAVSSASQSLSYQQLYDAVVARANWLSSLGVARIAINTDNSIDWVVTDLAVRVANLCSVPLPDFFTPAQQQHLLDEAGIELVLSDTPHPDYGKPVSAPSADLFAWRREVSSAPLMPAGTGKITFTSGSTGTPKGVCLSHSSQARVASMLSDKLALKHVRHLCLLPLPTLLENIAGVYAPLQVGGLVVLASRKERGFVGSQLHNPGALLALISRVRPHTLILIPALLQVLLAACQQGWTPSDSLQFIAVGGARVSPTLLTAAQQAGLPVFEGYGLSEAVSVSTLNVPGQSHQGSVGSPIGHNQLSVENGELVITGNTFLGYLNQPQSFYPERVYSGDLGRIEDGVVFIDGRKKNLIINAFGRNISPEWVESELMACGEIAQIVVAGDARPYLTALIVPRSTAVSDAALERAIARINQHLPDYASVERFRVVAPFTQANGLLTASGKVKRDAVLRHHADTLAQLYQTPQFA